MNKKHKLIIFLLTTFALINIMIYFSVFNIPSSSIKAQKGVVSLKQWDYEEVPIVELKGEWLFYPNKLLKGIHEASEEFVKTVPDFWGNGIKINSAKGYGVYRLTLTDLQPNKIYCFFIQDEVTAYTLNVNGEEVASNGVVSNNEDTYLPEWNPIIGTFNTDQDGKAEFYMEIANYSYNYGGFWNPINIGNPQDIIDYVVKRILVEFFLFITIFLIGVIFLILHFNYFSKYKEKSMFYFSLFSLCVSFRILFTGIRLIKKVIPDLDWNIGIRLEYFSGYLLLPLFCLFILYLLYQNKYKKLKTFIKVIIIMLGCSTLMLPHQGYISLLTSYKYTAVVLVILFMLIIFNQFKKNMFYKSLMMIALMSYLVAMIKEIEGGEISLIPISTLNFIICFSIIIFHQFLQFFKKNEMLAMKALLDSITGLYNRYFLNELSKNFFNKYEVNESAYVLFLDLDNFKYINDKYSHKIGDLVLEEIGNRLRKNFSDSDIICRYGGDEFVIIIKDDMNIDISEIAQRLIKIICEPIRANRETYCVGVSIGISRYPMQGMTLDELIKQSDQAMYEAKRNGGNQYVLQM